MNDTAITLSNDQSDRVAPGHAKGKQVSNWDIPTLAGAGALRSNIHDMLIFLNANIHVETTPLRDAIELAQTIQPRKKSHKLGWFLFILVEIGMLTSWATLGLGILGNLAIFMVAMVIVARLSPMLIPTGDMGLGWHVKSLDNENLFTLFKVSSWKTAFNNRKQWQVLPRLFLEELGLREDRAADDDDNGRIVWHNGATAGYRSYIGFAEGRDVGVVLLTNSTVPPDPTGLRLLNSLATLKAGQKNEERDGRVQGSVEPPQENGE